MTALPVQSDPQNSRSSPVPSIRRVSLARHPAPGPGRPCLRTSPWSPGKSSRPPAPWPDFAKGHIEPAPTDQAHLPAALLPALRPLCATGLGAHRAAALTTDIAKPQQRHDNLVRELESFEPSGDDDFDHDLARPAPDDLRAEALRARGGSRRASQTPASQRGSGQLVIEDRVLLKHG